jgi:hypothetical protein
MMRELETIALLAIAAGCNDVSVRVPPAVAADLASRWTVTFQVDTDVVWHGRSWPSLRGSIALVPNRTISREYPRIGRPAAYGVYDVDFAQWGFSPAGSRLPAIVAGAITADSVQLQFDTDREAFDMSMSGRLVGDTVRGRWSARESRAGLGHGWFTMTRLARFDSSGR